ncbi:MAG: DUF2818 family protein [Burkholderiales bacterium]|nr:DUF2818 family protein [Burkholderiales bacterium]MBK9346395.1 DUF2818 family protein [Burkholderiales bacterium]
MSASGDVWVIVVIAMLGANAPFFTERGFGIWHLNRPKSLGFRFLELCLSYGLVGCIGFMLEARAGQLVPQRWEFFAITVVLFLTLAFPGFVYRYLLLRRP